MHARRVVPLAALILAFSITSTAAQEVQNEDTAPAHTRHLHPHNPDHPISDDQSRFFTNRSSDIVLPLPGESDAFSFVVYGDRTGGPDAGINILKDAVRDTNLLEPDFVMTVGVNRIPIEVKYQRRPDPVRDTQSLRTFIERAVNNAPFGLLITQRDMDVDYGPNIVAMPLSTLMLLR